jgi:ABC-type transporter Mla subunit MlaD
MRPVPDERSVSIHELECVSEAMDGYLQSAAEAVADHGDTITDTEGAALAVAYMRGASNMHAAHVVAEALTAVAQQFERIADSAEVSAIKRAQLVSAVAAHSDAVALVASAITDHGAAVSAAIEVHSESIDRLADAIETRAP